jgi:hypothetical protein
MTGQNLIPEHRRRAWALRRAVAGWAMGLSVMALLVGGSVLGAAMTKAQPQAMPAGLREGLDLDKSKLALTRARIEAMQGVARAHDRADATPRWAGLLDLVARESQGRAQLRAIRVERLDAETPTWSVTIVGVAAAKERSEALAARLRATGLFANVHHGASPLQANREDIDFRIDCVIAPGESP